MGEPLDPFEDHYWRDIVPQETLDVYRVYRRETHLGAGPVALLAVDLFRGVFPDGPTPLAEAVRSNPRSCGIHAWRAKPVLRDLFALLRAHGSDIIYSTQATADAGTAAAATHRPASERDAGDVALHPDFAPSSEDLIVHKSRASVFFETSLAAHLHDRGIGTLVICGETTSGCVRATAVDAFSHGFHVVVVEDAVFDRSPLSHAMSLFDLHHKYADVMPLAELAAKLPGAPLEATRSLRTGLSTG
ncbi:MAG: isochorismatase family protein [Mycobacteriales bacterium]